MRTLPSLVVVILGLAACELQPGPPQPSAAPTPAPPASTPPAPTPPAPTPTEGPPPAAGSGAGSGVVPSTPRPAIQVTDQCVQIGVHVAAVVITSADPAQRAIFEQERERIVRSTAEVCTTQAWSADAGKCYLAAATQADLKDCEKKFPPPRVNTPAPPLPATNQPVVPGQPTQEGRRPERGVPVPGAAPRPGAGAGSGSAAAPRPPRVVPPRPSGAGSAAPH